MKGSLGDQLKAIGVVSKNIQQFEIYSVPDEAIDFPEERLGQKRQKHEKRLVIVLQNNQDNREPILKIVTVAPLSTGAQSHRLDYLLRKNDHPFLRADSFIRIQHVQPILKKDLTTKFGTVTGESFRDDIRDRLFLLLDL
jgi:mRNA-degrading endonuclease toxin of MazEF toxin-antitoxin module